MSEANARGSGTRPKGSGARPRAVRTTGPAGPAATESTDFRIEHDSMGEVRVPASAKWQAQTQRAVENFPISGTTVERSLISALASIKGAAALENARLKMVDKKVAQAVATVAAEVAQGRWDAEFPVDVFQT